MQALQNLGYTDYATYQATEQSLEDYGLASPEMTVSVVYTLDEQEASFTLALWAGRRRQRLCAHG